MGFNYREILIIFKKYAKKIKYVESKNIIKLIYGILIKRKIIIDGLNSGEIIEKIVDEVIREKNIKKIKDINFPLLIPSVDINNGKIYFFCSKEIRSKFSDKIVYDTNIKIAKAIRSSCSYPLVFAPCDYENTKLIDGGIKENVPWKETKRIGADKVLSIIFETTKKKCCNNVVEIASRSLDLICEELADYELEGADYLLKIKLENVSLLDTDKIDEIYKEGYYQAKRQMKKLKDFCLN